MANAPKYDAYYAEGRNALGEPFPEVIDYFAKIEGRKTVLDIGAGQGRDSIPIARLGHRVIAVDISSVGMAQLAEDAKAEGLDITTIVCDICTLKIKERIDVLLADRTFHMLGKTDRHKALKRTLEFTADNSNALIIDEPSNIDGLISVFLDANANWKICSKTRKMFTATRQGVAQSNDL